MQKQKRSIENCAKYTKIESKNHDFIQKIKFCEKLRDNKKFDSFEELKNQILDDIKSAKNYFINIY